MESFSFSPPINLFEERRRLLGVTIFEAMNSVLNITDENSNFSISTLRYWSYKGCAETTNYKNY